MKLNIIVLVLYKLQIFIIRELTNVTVNDIQNIEQIVRKFKTYSPNPRKLATPSENLLQNKLSSQVRRNLRGNSVSTQLSRKFARAIFVTKFVTE